MNPLTESLISCCRKSSNLLQRDFFELEILQNSSSTNNFCNKSFMRTKTLLMDELQKYSCPIYSLDEKFELTEESNTIILIDPIEGIRNFSKSIPFFASVIYYLEKTSKGFEIFSLIINFPILQETYYLEKSLGIYKNSLNFSNKHTRLRVSKFEDMNNSVIGTNYLRGFKNPKLQIREFGSFYYSMALFAAGKIDIAYMNSLTFAQKLAFETIVDEAGGKYKMIESDIMVAGNPILLSYVKS